MKKLFILLIVFAMAFSLVGCNNLASENTGNNSGMQMAFDMSKKAGEYTQQLFRAHLEEQGVTNYTLTQINRGFITDNPVVFIVGYQYAIDDSESFYGYKLSWDKEQTFTVLEEGVSVSEFIMK